jgi:hypothetical protein
MFPIDDILATVPARPSRSRLEPYRDLIEELRRRNVTFREIAEILSDRCDVHVSRAAVHDFLKRRLTAARRQYRPFPPPAVRTIQAVQSDKETVGVDSPFDFDEAEPLRLCGRAK